LDPSDIPEPTNSPVYAQLVARANELIERADRALHSAKEDHGERAREILLAEAEELDVFQLTEFSIAFHFESDELDRLQVEIKRSREAIESALSDSSTTLTRGPPK
jgi:hypothetical protein